MPIIKLFTIALLLLAAATASAVSDFCRGFERGYIAGHQRSSGNSLRPLVPLCPLQPLKGFGDPQSDFEHGYLIGVEHGTAAGHSYRY